MPCGGTCGGGASGVGVGGGDGGGVGGGGVGGSDICGVVVSGGGSGSCHSGGSGGSGVADVGATATAMMMGERSPSQNRFPAGADLILKPAGRKNMRERTRPPYELLSAFTGGKTSTRSSP